MNFRGEFLSKMISLVVGVVLRLRLATWRGQFVFLVDFEQKLVVRGNSHSRDNSRSEVGEGVSSRELNPSPDIVE